MRDEQWRERKVRIEREERAYRRRTLRDAARASARGDHDIARMWFALVGISYVGGRS